MNLTLHSDAPMQGDATKLRGFFATSFNEHALLHQHITDKSIYRSLRQIGYPKPTVNESLRRMIKAVSCKKNHNSRNQIPIQLKSCRNEDLTL